MHVLVVWIVCYLESQADCSYSVGKGHVITSMIDEIISWYFTKYIQDLINIFAIAITFYEYLIIFIYIITWLLVIYMSF